MSRIRSASLRSSCRCLRQERGWWCVQGVNDQKPWWERCQRSHTGWQGHVQESHGAHKGFGHHYLFSRSVPVTLHVLPLGICLPGNNLDGASRWPAPVESGWQLPQPFNVWPTDTIAYQCKYEELLKTESLSESAPKVKCQTSGDTEEGLQGKPPAGPFLVIPAKKTEYF